MAQRISDIWRPTATLPPPWKTHRDRLRALLSYPADIADRNRRLSDWLRIAEQRGIDPERLTASLLLTCLRRSHAELVSVSGRKRRALHTRIGRVENHLPRLLEELALLTNQRQVAEAACRLIAWLRTDMERKWIQPAGRSARLRAGNPQNLVIADARLRLRALGIKLRPEQSEILALMGFLPDTQ